MMNFKDHLRALEGMRDSTRPTQPYRKRYAHGGAIKGKMKALASEGRYGDTKLAEIGPRTSKMLDKAIHHGRKEINPRTGLREYMYHPNAGIKRTSSQAGLSGQGGQQYVPPHPAHPGFNPYLGMGIPMARPQPPLVMHMPHPGMGPPMARPVRPQPPRGGRPVMPVPPVRPQPPPPPQFLPYNPPATSLIAAGATALGPSHIRVMTRPRVPEVRVPKAGDAPLSAAESAQRLARNQQTDEMSQYLLNDNPGKPTHSMLFLTPAEIANIETHLNNNTTGDRILTDPETVFPAHGEVFTRNMLGGTNPRQIINRHRHDINGNVTMRANGSNKFKKLTHLLPPDGRSPPIPRDPLTDRSYHSDEE